MITLGDPDLWSDVFPDDLIPRILDLVWETWAALKPPRPDEYETRLTRRFRIALRQQRTYRDLPVRIEREVPEDDPTTAAELGRIDLKFTAVGIVSEDVYFAFECKRLYPIEKGTRKVRASEYVRQGMVRFTIGQYSATMKQGGMIGYVLNGRCDDALLAVQRNFAASRAALRMNQPETFRDSSLRASNPHIRETIHDFPPRGEFRLHHIFLAGVRDDAPLPQEDEPEAPPGIEAADES